MSAGELQYTISPLNDSTLAIEVFKTGLTRRKKHILFFEKFSGNLYSVTDRPEESRVEITIDANSAVCRDRWLKPRKQQTVTQFARTQALAADRYPEIRFTSTRIAAKELRGYVVEGELKIRGVGRMVKVNVVLSPKKQDKFQIDGDASVCLTDFGVPRPSHFLGLAGTRDEALIRFLLWANPFERQ